jgi:hypothetical protein
MCEMALPAHALQAVQVRFKSVGNEGHFTLEAESFIHSYLPTNCSGVIGICLMALPTHALQAANVRVKSVSNEGHFIL